MSSNYVKLFAVTVAIKRSLVFDVNKEESINIRPKYLCLLSADWFLFTLSNFAKVFLRKTSTTPEEVCIISLRSEKFLWWFQKHVKTPLGRQRSLMAQGLKVSFEVDLICVLKSSTEVQELWLPNVFWKSFHFHFYTLNDVNSSIL